MPLRTYPGRLLAASAVSSSLVLLACGTVAAYLYRDQSRTVEVLSEDIGSRGAAINLEATLNNLVALHGGGVASVEPLHEQVAADLAEIERYADKQTERELVRRATDRFAEYLRRWRGGAPPSELGALLRGEMLSAAQALRAFNGRELKASEGEHRGAVRRMLAGLVAVGGLGSVAGLVLGYGLARSLRRTIQQFLVRVQGASDLLGRQLPPVEVVRDGEPLADGADDLVRRVEQAVRRLQEQEREVLRAERLAAVGQLAAGVAHEIRNPLTSAILLLETGRKDPSAGGLTDEDLEMIEQELHRIEGTLQQFLDFARPPKLERAECDLRDVVRDALALTRGRVERAGVVVTVEAPDRPCRLLADRGQLRQVVLNLVLNAVEAMPAGGPLRVTLRPAPGAVELGVADGGPGIAAGMLSRLFEPFATGKETGTGLGLVISQRIVEDHGGTIAGANPPGGGALFTVRLPATPPA